MKNSFKIAFGGIISAFALILMLSTSLISFGTYAFPCLSGMLLVAIVIEFGTKWAYTAYVAVSLLSLFMAGDKEAVIYFIAFFGFYPILKSTLEKIKHSSLQYVVKYIIFNVCIISAFYAGKFILMIPDEEFTLFGVYIPWIFLIIANIFFILYDRCVTVMVLNYVHRIRNRIFKNK